MKRLIAIAVLGLALTACGSSGRINLIRPEIVKLVPPSPAAFHFSTASNREFARRDIQKLLRIVVLPSSARRVASAPSGAPRWLRNNWGSRGGTPGAATARRLWVVRGRAANVQAFIRTHVHPRPRPEVPFRSRTSGIAFRNDGSYEFPPVPGRSWSRWLSVDITPLKGGSTAVLEQASEWWNRTVPHGEELGRTVKRIEIRSEYPGQRSSVLLHLRNAYAVASIVAWMNGLSGNASRIVCFGDFGGGPTVTLAFRSREGTVLARATVADIAGRSGPCNPVSLTIGKRSRPQYLIGADLLLRIQRLLGIDLAPITPPGLRTCLRGWKVVRRSPNTRTVSHDGKRWTVTFPASGNVTVTGPRKPSALLRCVRSSPYLVGYR
jgi:hypothetical protein